MPGLVIEKYMQYTLTVQFAGFVHMVCFCMVYLYILLNCS